MLTAFLQAPRWIRRGTLLLAGLLNCLAFAPYNFALIPFLTLALLMVDISDSENAKQAGLSGFIYGLGWFGAGISWVHVSIDTFGGLPLIASLAMMALLVSYLAIYPALTTLTLVRFVPDKRHWWLALPILWLLSEWLRSIVFTGFPWLSLGYSQLNSPLANLAPIIGEVGITFVICIIAVILMQLAVRPIRQANIKIGVAIIVLTAGSYSVQWTERKEQTKTITLVQGNIKQELKWAPENDWPTLLKYMDMSRPHYAESDLIIWPEAAIPMIEPSAVEDLAYLDKALSMNRTALITGIIDFNVENRNIYNALIALGLKEPEDTNGQYYYPHNNRYYKHHLLPIGEFVPFEDILRPLAPIFDLPMSSFTRGNEVQPNLRANGINLVPAICYEIIFPRLLRQNVHAESDVILTVSNDAWFGTSAGPLQHMQIAQMRALEFGRPVIRSTNNGVTAITDEKGRIIKQVPQFEDAVLKTEVQLVSGVTPYLRFGDWPLWIVSLLGLIYLLIVGAQSREQLDAPV